MKTLFTFMICCLCLVAAAQKKGEVVVVKDPLLDSLMERRLILSRQAAPAATAAARRGGSGVVVSQMGYRVQVYYGGDRRQTFSEQARFKSRYPKLNTYITYKEPNYYLRVGDFRSRLEAQKMMIELRGMFKTLFIFREKINAPSL